MKEEVLIPSRTLRALAIICCRSSVYTSIGGGPKARGVTHSIYAGGRGIRDVGDCVQVVWVSGMWEHNVKGSRGSSRSGDMNAEAPVALGQGQRVQPIETLIEFYADSDVRKVRAPSEELCFLRRA